MTHEEICQEADRLSGGNREARRIIFQALKDKEHAKLVYNKVYKYNENSMWYIDIELDKNQKDTFYFPFGSYATDYLNQLMSIKSKELFIAYEKKIRSGFDCEEKIDPAFNKPSRFFLWNFNECSNFEPAKQLSDEELEEMYNEVSWIWKYIQNDLETLIDILKRLLYADKDTRKRFATPAYQYIRQLVIKIWRLQDTSSSFLPNNKAMKLYNLSDEDYYAPSDEEIESMIGEIEELSTNTEWLVKLTASQIRFMGYEDKIIENKPTPCEKYDIPSLLFLIPEDFMTLLLDQTKFSFDFCSECNCLYVRTHENQKYCPACSPNVANRHRKNNEERYLHKKILDRLLNSNHLEKTDAVYVNFKAESNYYWAIVQGKKPERIKEYSTKIKTKADYKNWLEAKLNEFKHMK